jgi:hypothetical protein
VDKAAIVDKKYDKSLEERTYEAMKNNLHELTGSSASKRKASEKN